MPLDFSSGLSAFEVWKRYQQDKASGTASESVFTPAEKTSMRKSQAGKAGGANTYETTSGNGFVPLPVLRPRGLLRIKRKTSA